MYTDESKLFVGILRTQSFFHAHQIVVRIITNTLLVFHLLFPVEITTVNEYAVHSYE